MNQTVRNPIRFMFACVVNVFRVKYECGSLIFAFSTLTIPHHSPASNSCLTMLHTLRRIRRKESPSDEGKILDSLLGRNDPPSVEQRQGLETHLMFLKSEYQRACGEEYSPSRRIPVTKEVLKYRESIERYHRALSCVRAIPIEIWQGIFMWAVPSIELRSPQCSTLGTIRLVSRGWNAAACSCPMLWCNLPIISFPQPLFTPPSSSAIAEVDTATGPWILERCLARSGRQPISFTFHMRPDTDDSPGAHLILAKAYLRILLEASQRWKVVEFRATKAILDILLDRSRHGRLSLPRLSEFVFQLLIVSALPSGSRITVDMFKDVPVLRHVGFTLQDTWGSLSSRRINEVVDLRLPWKQLESFQGNVAYPTLVRRGTNLRLVRYVSKRSNDLPSTPTCHPHLTKLSLCLGDGLPGGSLLRHLGSLTLPALKELELFWRKNAEVDLYGSILALVKRSKCSLERLATDPHLDYKLNNQIERFTDVLYHCSTLTHLDISYLDVGELDVLIPDRDHFTTPPLVNLRVLTLRFSRLAKAPIDPTTLLRVIHSRTEGAKGLESQLEDVYIKHCSNDHWRAAVTKLVRNTGSIGPPDTPTNSGFPEAWRWKQEIMTFFPPSKTGPRLDKADYVERQEIRRGCLGKLEPLDLWGRDTRILSWLGIPALLNSIGLDKERKPDKWKNFSVERQRAQDLLKKWKPYLLTGFRSSPYRWCYIDENTSRIRYVGDAASQSKMEKEKDWERILGKGDIDHWAAGSKGFA
ncbi:hypothetical protein NMY22_g5231 [Coprinellus aureogranulatus]|nr:hypothetical protein NMY22_g5231 [Coprinellus aureogranulatus]